MRQRFRFDPITREVYEVTGDECIRASASPHIISDHMDALVHPVNGKIYDSKSKFRSVTRASGCTEVGNERMRENVDRGALPGIGADIARAISELGG